ncbi:hypothetical protein Q5424_21730 [Conexibacter sp. JD483]|uniref:hypothetical protein n=1 Tax=unclassified Conexibacter TaxID=2627773 RepID=UPI00271BF254|nr:MULTISPECIES: hypothetical protein [unclassified Conexibacter]MDO8189119.1 hypothetical protein [Conexibacter sp. CPCC 205706]MDO8201884.1 hypothetical protein [Conexibacter sp. CPCC 205762]MDR9371734.1 hypothetical protein [Conexibacter sp. JD483]
MRELLLKVQADSSFAELVRARPEEAAAGFDVDAAEVALLRAPDWSLQPFLVPAHRIGERPLQFGAGEPNSLDLLNQPPDQQHTVLTLELPPTTLPDLSQLHPPTEHPPTEHPPTEHPPTEEPPPRRPGEIVGIDIQQIKILRDEVLAATGAIRQERIVALLEAIGG